MIHRRTLLGAVPALLAGCGPGGRPVEPVPTYAPRAPDPIRVAFDIAAFLFPHPFFKLVAAMKIIDSIDALIASYHADTRTVSFQTLNPQVTGTIDASRPDAQRATFTTPHDDFDFAPYEFVASNLVPVDDAAALEAFDARLLADLRDCTGWVEASEENNLVRKLRMRADCLDAKGHDQTAMRYLVIKGVQA